MVSQRDTNRQKPDLASVVKPLLKIVIYNFTSGVDPLPHMWLLMPAALRLGLAYHMRQGLGGDPEAAQTFSWTPAIHDAARGSFP